MANLLSIPSSKTLLRRHLTLCFNTLVGQANLAIKRECESQPTFKPLTTTGACRTSNLVQFAIFKKLTDNKKATARNQTWLILCKETHCRQPILYTAITQSSVYFLQRKSKPDDEASPLRRNPRTSLTSTTLFVQWNWARFTVVGVV